MDAELKLHIAAVIRAARKAKKITQEQLADRIDRTPESLSNLERGQAAPSIETAIALCHELDIKIDRLFSLRPSDAVRTPEGLRIAEEIHQLIDRLDEGSLPLAKEQLESLLKYQKSVGPS